MTRSALAILVVAASLAACGSDSGGSAPSATSPCEGERWVGAWAAAPSDATTTYSDQSLRAILTPLRGGTAARVRLSNRFGTDPVTVRSVHLGKQGSGAELAPGSNVALTFGGRGEVGIPAGEDVVSDPVAFSFAAFEHLAVSLFVPAPGGRATEHARAKQTSFVADASRGDLSAEEAGDGFGTAITSRPFVTGVDVIAPGPESVVVAIGDSITDGDQRDANENERAVDLDARYPDALARRVNAEGRSLSVLNLGIGGNRVLRDAIVPAMGPSLLHRLGPDVLSRDDVTDVILLEGINDLGLPPNPSADEVIAGLQQAVDALKTAAPGRSPLNVLVGTITPAGGTAGTYASSYAAAEPRRAQVNEWIRTHGIGDGFVDFDAAVRDPSDPSKLAAAYDGGDGLHLSPAGHEQMAKAVELAKLVGRGCSNGATAP